MNQALQQTQSLWAAVKDKGEFTEGFELVAESLRVLGEKRTPRQRIFDEVFGPMKWAGPVGKQTLPAFKSKQHGIPIYLNGGGLEKLNDDALMEAVKFCKGNKTEAIKKLKIVRSTFYRRFSRIAAASLLLLLTVAATPLRSPKDVSPAPVMRQVNISPTLKTNVVTRTLTRSEMVHPALLVEMTNGVMVKVLWTNSIGSVGADFARLSWKGTNTLKVVYLLTDTNATSFQFYGLSNGPPWVIELVGVNVAGDGPISNVTFWDRWEDTVWAQSRKNADQFADFGPPVARWTNTPPEKMREYRMRVGRVRQ